MAESNFVTSIGKGETMDISETAAASGMKIGRYRTYSVNESKLVFKVKVISCPWPKVIYI